MVTEKTSALGAMVSVLVDIAPADRALAGIAKPWQLQLGSQPSFLLVLDVVLDARIGWGWVAHRLGSYYCQWFRSPF